MVRALSVPAPRHTLYLYSFRIYLSSFLFMQRLANSAAFVDITLPFLLHCDTHQAAARVEPYQHRKYLYASNYYWIPSHLFGVLVRAEALDDSDGVIVAPFTITAVFKPRLICSGIKAFTFFIKSLYCVFA